MLYVLPNAGTAAVVRFLDQTTGPLVINNYFLDDPAVLSAIRGDVSRGEKVWVILDPKPYGIGKRLVHREFAEVRATGAYVTTPPSRFVGGYVNDHAKYAVAGKSVLIGTANWSDAAFRKNREYIYVSTDPSLVRAMQKVAMADLRKTPADLGSSLPAKLVLSPGAAPKIAAMIDQPGPVMMEAEEVRSDAPVFRALEAKGSDLTLILPRRPSATVRRSASMLVARGVHVFTMARSTLYMHAKAIVGREFGWIGSENISRESLDANREVGVEISSPRDMATLRRTIAGDLRNAVPFSEQR